MDPSGNSFRLRPRHPHVDTFFHLHPPFNAGSDTSLGDDSNSMRLLSLWPDAGPASYTPVAALVLLGLAAWRVRLWYRLRHIPGPKSAGWSVLWNLRAVMGEDYHEKLKGVAEEYGPLVRIGPNELLSTDPDVLRRMSAARSTYTKGSFYKSGQLTPGVDNVVSVTDEVKHKEMRARMWSAYSGKENEGFSFESGMDRQILNFMDLLSRKYTSTRHETRPFDLAEKTQYFALDTIGDISMGAPFGYLTNDDDLYDYNRINADSLIVMNIVSVLPWLTKIVHQWPFRLAMPREGDQVGLGRLMSFASHYVEKRLDPNTEPVQDMLQGHINTGMTRDELIQQVLIFLIAGSNSTAHVLRMTLLSLMTNPSVYNALVTEIRQASPQVSNPISFAQTQTQPYLMAVVREGMRMWPPVSGLGLKRVPPEGDYINGYFVPGGTEIGQGYHALGRSKDVWGPDADVFRPERWLVADEEEFRNLAAAADTHFGHGKYSCLGKPIALMELHKVIFELLRRHDMSLINPEKPVKVKSSVFMAASDLWVKITEREA